MASAASAAPRLRFCICRRNHALRHWLGETKRTDRGPKSSGQFILQRLKTAEVVYSIGPNDWRSRRGPEDTQAVAVCDIAVVLNNMMCARSWRRRRAPCQEWRWLSER